MKQRWSLGTYIVVFVSAVAGAVLAGVIANSLTGNLSVGSRP